jgi:hypothetical protein
VCSPNCPAGNACGANADCAEGVCTNAACVLPVSCAALHAARPALASGTYTIAPPGGGPVDAYCDMTTDGGGWTVVFAPTTLDYKSTTLDYTLDSAGLMAGATQVLLAYRTTVMTVISDWAVWNLTNNWRVQSPFAYQAVDEVVSVSVTGAAPVNSTLRYGYSNWPTLCTDPWTPASNYGRLCLTGTTAPFYGGWSIGAGNYCSNSEQAWNVTLCTANLMTTIAVR